MQVGINFHFRKGCREIRFNPYETFSPDTFTNSLISSFFIGASVSAQEFRHQPFSGENKKQQQKTMTYCLQGRDTAANLHSTVDTLISFSAGLASNSELSASNQLLAFIALRSSGGVPRLICRCADMERRLWKAGHIWMMRAGFLHNGCL